jgi:predicted nuclease of restriction endonuclease-like (RecB) superfamily
VSSQYYHRLLQSQDKAIVRDEMKMIATPLQDKLEFLKNPVVAEFLGFKNNTNYTESNLEQSIIDHLVPFLMELGKGFAFVDRQKHIHTEKEDYYIDLVFYNYHLRSFVLIDLKTTKLRYQDVGQMDMYVKMYDELVRPEGHNPTIGMLLCADTDEDVAHYSVLNNNDQLFAAKYLTYMPTQEELRREIEQQKTFFRMQHP